MIFNFLCFVYLMFFISCNPKPYKTTGNDSILVLEGNKQKLIVTDTLLSFNKDNRVIELPLDPKKGDLNEYKFIEIEIKNIINPDNYPITFEASYSDKETGEIFLGSFSPYPADKPGKFIVPTQNKIKQNGKIILTLLTDEKNPLPGGLSVTAGRVNLIK